MDHVTIMTNMWGNLSPKLGEARETELKNNDLFYKLAVDAGATVLRNDNPPQSGRDIISAMLQKEAVHLAIQIELSENGTLLETTAGAQLDRDLAEKRVQHETDITKLNQEYELAKQQQDAETQAELEEELAQRREGIAKVQHLVDKLQEKRSRSIWLTEPMSNPVSY
jgi:hypothetical protein